VLDQFADLVASAAQPIDDVRGTAAYRRHGCQVLARRAITWALDERRLPTWL
jgi:CO/xanthine dehydrogenase FAD-binding subunit